MRVQWCRSARLKKSYKTLQSDHDEACQLLCGVCAGCAAGRQGAADLAEVGEVVQEDALDDVLHRCEAIATDLRALLGEQRMADRQVWVSAGFPCVSQCGMPAQDDAPLLRAGLHGAHSIAKTCHSLRS